MQPVLDLFAGLAAGIQRTQHNIDLGFLLQLVQGDGLVGVPGVGFQFVGVGAQLGQRTLGQRLAAALDRHGVGRRERDRNRRRRPLTGEGQRQ
ncbi:MAG: hypothetical protein K1X50_07275 [Candidatus Promineofilum sp.]|nr:hypothetical protein [Promineifilum sp.]